MERITSSHNPLVQHMRKLQTSRAYRESCGEFVADGWKLLEEALKWYPEVTAVLTSEPERCPALPSSARLVEVPASLMQSVSVCVRRRAFYSPCACRRRARSGCSPACSCSTASRTPETSARSCARPTPSTCQSC
ncbi:MAG: hypothetical protein ACLR8M_08070 [Oscillospiraceae bacterium]